MRCIAMGFLLGALVVSGCGRDGDRSEARTTTARFLRAVHDGDGPLACAQLSPAAVKQLQQQEQGSCPAKVAQLQLGQAAIRAVEVYNLSAKVDLADGASAFLDHTAAGWRLAAVGCRPTEGDPRSHPMSCELES